MNNNPSFLQEERQTCPECGNRNLVERTRDQQFNYGARGNQVVLTASMPVFSCESCGYEYFDERGETARHAAVCKYLGVSTPDEIRTIREGTALTRAEFAELGGFGLASIQRWESGSVVPNASSDRLIYLLQYESNVQLLRQRHSLADAHCSENAELVCSGLTASEGSHSTCAGRRIRTFQRLSNDSIVREQALHWKLRQR